MVRPVSPNIRFNVPGASAWTSVRPPEDVWATLERFAHDVGQCDLTAGLPRLALEAVRAAIDADAAFWHPGAGSDAFEAVGDCSLSPDWCSQFTTQLLAKTPGVDGRLLCSALPPEPRTALVRPHSAALVRVSKTHGSWLVALSLSPRRRFQATDLQIMGLVRQILVNQRRRCDLSHRMADTLSWLVRCLATSIDARLPHAQGHSERVARIAVEIGKRMRLPNLVLTDLYFAGLLHDIGNTGVQQNLLLKPSRLTNEEYAQVKISPIIGDGILTGIKQLSHLRPAVRHLHEHYDGRGYPDQLAGDEIPLMARILSVADAFDAMLSPRPHRPALANARVDAVLTEGAGKRWDPGIIDQFLVHRKSLHALRDRSSNVQTASAVKHVVGAWNAGSSRTVAVRGAKAPAASDAVEEVAQP